MGKGEKTNRKINTIPWGNSRAKERMIKPVSGRILGPRNSKQEVTEE
jgi:hypothetical protein